MKEEYLDVEPTMGPTPLGANSKVGRVAKERREKRTKRKIRTEEKKEEVHAWDVPSCAHQSGARPSMFTVKLKTQI